MSDYIGISENRLKHTLGVARKAYSLAKEMGYDENFARRMFMLGWCHDVGYEFSKKPDDHADISAEMLLSLMGSYDESYSAIENHGKYIEDGSMEWRLLTMADMLVDSSGREVDVVQRLRGIKNRYGSRSVQYVNACDVCYRIGLTAINLSDDLV